MPPKNRKYECGNDKHKKKKKIEELIQSQVGALDKFLIKEPQISNESHYVDNIDVEFLDNVPIENNNLDSVPFENDNLDTMPIENDNLDSVPIVDEVNNNDDVDNLEEINNDDDNVDYDIFDPRNWDRLQPKMVDLLVAKDPKRDNSIKELDKLFCFCCKVFKNGICRGQLANEGYSDWVHVGARIKEHELAFRGSKEKFYEDSNDNFLGLIEMLAEFDSIIQEHTKYFSVILDCTPDISHQEQMSLIIRYVDISSASISIEESFFGFLNVNDTTGQGLFDVLQNELKELGLDLFDVRGQGYDNGSNMKGKHQGYEVSENDLDPKIQNEAKSLATNELGDFDKLLQEKDMLIDVAMKNIKGLISYFEEYRETGFYKALVNAKEIAMELNIAPTFPQRQLKLLREMLPEETIRPADILLFLKGLDCFPNTVIAYRILLTIPVTVASAERSFSKLKLLKTYLRSTMSQERLNGLALIAVENDIFETIKYEDLVNEFASKSVCRKALFK
ncbi:uncharacterized protein LOC127137189 [Lathyrus oleraceus]|uniref:uncharacterized protein LOC127137189 n=1 Tax=Pisum sativum TaxID=3888 RepID=UPI0021D07D01|nr:uncharacterized protein LOC127137189 [Pisum sativum]